MSEGPVSERLHKLREVIKKKWVPDFDYVTSRSDDIPWAPMRKSLRECKVAVISTGGFHLRSDEPFDADNPYGDPTYRVISATATRDQLGIAHTHYDHKYVNEDLNVAFPLAIFRELEREGVIGRLAENNYSFMGYLPVPDRLINVTAPEVAGRLAADGVDAALLVPT